MANITAASITLRSTKGSPLTNNEVDANFNNLNTALATGLTAASYTASDVLTKLLTVDGATSGLDADLVRGLATATANTASTMVARDASGNFSAGTITANLTGTASIASSLNYTVLVGGGGTGATTAAGARTNLGLVIGTDVQAYDAELAALASVTSAVDTAPYFTGSGTASTYSATSYMRGLMGSVAASNARSTLGLVIGTDIQAYSAELVATSGLATTGIIARTGAGTKSTRTITAGTGITVTNGDGVAGNPTITAAVTSVQGATGAVVVSVPVTSVQGNTGAVTVTNISGSAGSASSATYAGSAGYAGTAGGGWPGHLSQFSNNLGNYGAWVPHNAKSASNNLNWGPGGSQGNCGHNPAGSISYLYLDTGSGFNGHHYQQNCHNCNCNC